MNKNIVLVVFLLNGVSNLQANQSSFWALLASLFEKPKRDNGLLENDLKASQNALCASGCNSVGQVELKCKGGHKMCKSCLRSRVTGAHKRAQQEGTEVYAVCPKCGDMLTNDVIKNF